MGKQCLLPIPRPIVGSMREECYPWVQVSVHFYGDDMNRPDANVYLMNDDVWKNGTDAKSPLISLFQVGLYWNTSLPGYEGKPYYGKMQENILRIWDDLFWLRIFFRRHKTDEERKIYSEFALDIINRPKRLGITEIFKRPPKV